MWKSFSCTVDKTHIVYEDGYLIIDGVLSAEEVDNTPKENLISKEDYEAQYPSLSLKEINKIREQNVSSNNK
jgi:hypothetical protein